MRDTTSPFGDKLTQDNLFNVQGNFVNVVVSYAAGWGIPPADVAALVAERAIYEPLYNKVQIKNTRTKADVAAHKISAAQYLKKLRLFWNKWIEDGDMPTGEKLLLGGELLDTELTPRSKINDIPYVKATGIGGGDTLTMFPTPQTALDQGGIIATTVPASVDLSTIIPLNTKAVIVSIACINQSYTDGGMMAYIYRQLGAEYALQVMAPPVNAPGISNGGSVLMPVATDRTLTWQAYVAGNNSTELVIYILGYVI